MQSSKLYHCNYLAMPLEANWDDCPSLEGAVSAEVPSTLVPTESAIPIVCGGH